MKNGFLKCILVTVFLSNCFLFSQSNSAVDGQEVYKKRCVGCHGPSGDVKAFGVSRKLTELTAGEMANRLKALSDKKMQGVGGASGTMHKQISAVSKEEYEAVLAYITSAFAAISVESSMDTSLEQNKTATNVNIAANPTTNRSQNQLRLVVTQDGNSITQ
ncbi:MAG: cytochrome c [Campylobacteraceae bacterium]|jgi:cytochrome c553|nr:cytochrome c [Campylobacteraceae bacterium]